MIEPRLDAATLRWVADLITEASKQPALDEAERGAAKGFAIVADGLYERAAEAASLLPTLADWVRAAEVSRLGMPAWVHCFTGIEARWEGARVRLSFSAKTPTIWHGHGDGFTTCTTPAALTAALDRIARMDELGVTEQDIAETMPPRIP